MSRFGVVPPSRVERPGVRRLVDTPRRPEGPAPLDFSTLDVGVYGDPANNAGGVARPTDGGRGLEVLGNAWRTVELPEPIAIRPGAVLALDFVSHAPGDMQGVGLDDGPDVTGERLFVLRGEGGSKMDPTHRDDDAIGWRTLRIALGGAFAGVTARYLTLMNDHDVPEPDAHLEVRDVRIIPDGAA